MKKLSKFLPLFAASLMLVTASCSGSLEEDFQPQTRAELSVAEEAPEIIGVNSIMANTEGTWTITQGFEVRTWRVSGVTYSIQGENNSRIVVTPTSAGSMQIVASCVSKATGLYYFATKNITVTGDVSLPRVIGPRSTSTYVMNEYTLNVPESYTVTSWRATGVTNTINTSNTKKASITALSAGTMTVTAACKSNSTGLTTNVSTTTTVTYVAENAPEITGVSTAQVGLQHLWSISSGFDVASWTVTGVTFNINGQGDNFVNITPLSTGIMTIKAQCVSQVSGLTYTTQRSVPVR